MPSDPPSQSPSVFARVGLVAIAVVLAYGLLLLIQKRQAVQLLPSVVELHLLADVEALESGSHYMWADVEPNVDSASEFEAFAFRSLSPMNTEPYGFVGLRLRLDQANASGWSDYQRQNAGRWALAYLIIDETREPAGLLRIPQEPTWEPTIAPPGMSESVTIDRVDELLQFTRQ